MSGWMRLFLGVCVLICVPLFAYWVLLRPTPATTYHAAGCDGFYQQYDAETAQKAISTKSYVQAEHSSFKCAESLEEIASGRRLSERTSDWWADLSLGVRFVGGFLCALFIIGWGIGWIWRGFFPKKPSST